MNNVSVGGVDSLFLCRGRLLPTSGTDLLLGSFLPPDKTPEDIGRGSCRARSRATDHRRRGHSGGGCRFEDLRPGSDVRLPCADTGVVSRVSVPVRRETTLCRHRGERFPRKYREGVSTVSVKDHRRSSSGWNGPSQLSTGLLRLTVRPFPTL